MAFYRSELEVPVNKTTAHLRNDNEFSSNSKNHVTIDNSTLDNWREKVRFHLHNDRFPPNNIRENLPSNDSIGPSFTKFNDRNVDCFNIIDMFQQLQSKIAKGADGNMHFTARFDVKYVNPDSVKVFVKEGSVVISVEQMETQTRKLSSSMEYTRKFNLPANIVVESITCTLSSDNILCLDGLLDCASSNRQGSTPNMSTSLMRDHNSSSSLSSSCYLTPRPDQRYRINITIGSGYDPLDINIKTRDDKVFINARHEEKSESRTNYREFSKEVTLPENVDSLSLSAIFNNGILYIEAPYV